MDLGKSNDAPGFSGHCLTHCYTWGETLDTPDIATEDNWYDSEVKQSALHHSRWALILDLRETNSLSGKSAALSPLTDQAEMLHKHG